jgi:quercetin dioxygenase-like cupin family protein
MRIRIVIPVLVSVAAAAPVSAQPEVVIHFGHETPEWRSAPSGAAFARLYGDPARAEPFAFLMKMPTDWTMQPHVHDTGEYLTVLSGVLYMSFVRDGEWTELSPGSVIAIPPGVPMWAKTGDKETVIEVNGVGPFQTDPVPEEIVPEE